MKLDLKINFRFNPAALRKYSILLVPIGILLGTGIVFGLTVLSGRSLKAQIQTQSVDISKRIGSMVSTAPSSRQWEQKKVVMDKLEEEANQIKQLALQDTQRSLLSYKVFPKPKETSHQIYTEFGERFRQGVEGWVQAARAVDAPSDAELTKDLGADVLRQLSPGTASGMDTRSSKSVVDGYCSKRAMEAALYANPKHLPWYGFWDKYRFEGEETAVKDCWYSQVAYWVYEDIFTTIQVLNEGSSSVFTSPVKRLVGISFQGSVEYPKSARSGMEMTLAEGFRDNPMYVQDPMKGMTAGDPRMILTMGTGQTGGAPAWTGRYCNPEIDVIHFTVGVVTDARSVAQFMRELCSEKKHTFRVGFAANGKEMEYRHNSITILGSSVEPVERTNDEHLYFRYGPAAVVTLMLDCEYVFHRAGYDSIQPDLIKKELGIAIPAAEGSTPPGGPGTPAPGAGTPYPTDRRR